MTKLATTYLGLPLRSPLIASAGPLTGRVDTLRELEDAGIAAVVLPSLFEEEVEADSMLLHEHLERGVGTFAESISGYFPELPLHEVGPELHVRHVERAKAALGIPVVASVNAGGPGAWVRYARMLVEAGADAIELNIYDVAADPAESGQEVEARLLDTMHAVRAEVAVPLAVKLGPYLSAMAHFALRLAETGADGLVLFNRFYQPDIDLETLEVAPRVTLSDPRELRLPLRWIGILRPLLPHVSLCCSSGVHRGRDAAKVLLAGADVAAMTSALLLHGPGHVAEVERELVDWMAEHEYVSVDQLRGSVSARTARDPRGYERAQYFRTLTSYPVPAYALQGHHDQGHHPSGGSRSETTGDRR